jgi:hypothetical protein
MNGSPAFEMARKPLLDITDTNPEPRDFNIFSAEQPVKKPGFRPCPIVLDFDF